MWRNHEKNLSFLILLIEYWFTTSQIATASRFVLDWVGGNLLHIKADGNFKVLEKLSQGAADHEVIHDKKILIMPLMNDGKLVAFKIK
jgi:hypothetical protein